jgi:hypothetical protein
MITIVFLKFTIRPFESVSRRHQVFAKDIEYFRMGFFDLVEKYDAIRAAAHSFGQLAAFVVADVAGRGADDLGHAVLFHEFAHIKPDKRSFVIEHEIRQSFAQLGFPYAGGPTNRNEPIGRCSSLMPARERLMALATDLMASSWPLTLFPSSSSALASF